MLFSTLSITNKVRLGKSETPVVPKNCSRRWSSCRPLVAVHRRPRDDSAVLPRASWYGFFFIPGVPPVVICKSQPLHWLCVYCVFVLSALICLTTMHFDLFRVLNLVFWPVSRFHDGLWRHFGQSQRTKGVSRASSRRFVIFFVQFSHHSLHAASPVVGLAIHRKSNAMYACWSTRPPLSSHLLCFSWQNAQSRPSVGSGTLQCCVYGDPSRAVVACRDF